MDPEVREILDKQGYKVIGDHGAVKVCHYSAGSMTCGKACYKNEFYGIASHRCVQMTPAADHCNQRCLFCWRVQTFDEHAMEDPDDPVELVEGSLQAQRELISGYKGHDGVELPMYREAAKPQHVAISLTGEPTMYPHLDRLIEEYHKRGISTFLVTNGTTPEVLADLDPLPTQLYVSVDAPDRGTYEKLCVPMWPNAWERIRETLELTHSLDTRIVHRHIMVDGWNMDPGSAEGFADLDRLGDPDFIECKGYTHVGPAMKRMREENMPDHERVRAFAERLAGELGWELAAEQDYSRAALVTEDGTTEPVELPEATLPA